MIFGNDVVMEKNLAEDLIDLTKDEEEEYDVPVVIPPHQQWIDLFEYVYAERFPCKFSDDVNSVSDFFETLKPISSMLWNQMGHCHLYAFHVWDEFFGASPNPNRRDFEHEQQRIYGVRAPGTFPLEVCIPCLLRLFVLKSGWKLLLLPPSRIFDPLDVYPSSFPMSDVAPHALIDSTSRRKLPSTLPQFPDLPSSHTTCGSSTIKLRSTWNRQCFSSQNFSRPCLCWRIYAEVSKQPRLRRSVWLCEQCIGLALAIGPPFFFLKITDD